jgi:hypothetical protein
MVFVDANKENISATKTIMKHPSYLAIGNKDSNFKNKVLFALTLPVPYLKSGIYLIPKENVKKVDDALEQFKVERAALVQEFIEIYPMAVVEAANDLRSVYRASDYPTPEKVRSQFYVASEYIKILPGDVDDPVIAARAKASLEAKLDQAYQDAQLLLWNEMKAFLSEMVDKLNPTGERKIVRTEKFDQFLTFYSNLKVRNITNDKDLEKLAGEVRQLVLNVTTDIAAIRKSEELRDAVRDQFEQARKVLDESMEKLPMREINFDD